MKGMILGAAIGLACVAHAGSASADISLRLACKLGNPRCVESVIQEMEQRFRPLARRCDHDAIFSLLYLRTTQKFDETLLALGYSGVRAVVREDALFADYYFRAHDAYRQRRGFVPPAWQIALSAAEQRAVSGIGNALLGMNAHIQRDLPFVLFELDRRGHPVSYEDHNRINVFLAQVDAAEELAARFDPIFTAGIDPAVLAQLIANWRELAFLNYLRLRDAPDLRAWLTVAADIERYAAEMARAFAQQTAYPAGTDSAARDAHCSAARDAD
ncbi:MAG TPA: DUF5995 family protein [Polyangiaceae bacterium]